MLGTAIAWSGTCTSVTGNPGTTDSAGTLATCATSIRALIRRCPLGTVKPHTDESYAAIGWKWATLKYSYAFSNLFGVEDSEGSDYLDLTITVPLNDRFTIAGHAGRQKFRGASTAALAAGTTNDALYSYEDYRATLSYILAEGWTTSLTFTTTNAEDAGYTVLGKNIGDDQVIVGITRTF